jgi:hypothetical protein
MLKIIYSETGIHLELIAVNHKQWIAERLKFANSVGEPMLFCRQRATFLVPSPLCEVTNIDADLRNLGANTVTVYQCDLDYVEVELSGYWLSPQLGSAEGIFVGQQTDPAEFYLWQLWNAANEGRG